MAEYVKAIKVVHQALLLTSAAVLAFALIPNREPLLDKADATLRNIGSHNSNEWNNFVYGLQAENQAQEDDYVNGLLHRLDPSYRPTPMPMFIYSDLRYPLGDKLADIRDYLAASQTLKLFGFKRDSQSIEKQWKEYLGQPNTPPPAAAPQTRTPSIASVTLVPPGGSWAGDAFGRFHLVPLNQESTDRSSRIMLTFDPATVIAPKANSLSLFANCQLKKTLTGPFAIQWLKSVDTNRLLIRTDHGKDEIFPDLVPFWDEISNSSVEEARTKLREDKQAQRGKVAVFGLSIDSGSTVTVMPWVLCSILLFLVAHIRQLRKWPDSDGSPGVAWVGLFDDWAGQLITWVTVLILPVLSCAILIARYGSGVGSASVRYISGAAVGLLSIWAMVELARLRRALKGTRIGGNVGRSDSGLNQANATDGEDDDEGRSLLTMPSSDDDDD